MSDTKDTDDFLINGLLILVIGFIIIFVGIPVFFILTGRA